MAALAFATPAAASDWHVLDMNLDTGFLLADVESIRDSSMWTAFVELGEVDGPPIKFMHLEFDCQGRLVRLSQSVSYDDDGNVIESAKHHSSEFNSPPPESRGERFMSIVCDDADPGIAMKGLTPFDVRP